ncbi:MAG: hypothetical protein KDK07_07880 [Bauldia sp.]|nr:hypothetical protein [Bauldia sp.]
MDAAPDFWADAQVLGPIGALVVFGLLAAAKYYLERKKPDAPKDAAAPDMRLLGAMIGEAQSAAQAAESARDLAQAAKEIARAANEIKAIHDREAAAHSEHRSRVIDLLSDAVRLLDRRR